MVKPLSETRWMCRADSVKTIRYQAGELYDMLVEISEKADKPVAKRVISRDSISFGLMPPGDTERAISFPLDKLWSLLVARIRRAKACLRLLKL